MNKIRIMDYTKLSAYFLLFVLLGFAEIKGGIRPFGIGLLIGLVYCRQNILLLAPLYIISMLIAEFSWQSLVQALSPIVILSIAYYIHYLLKKRIKISHIMIYALLCQLPLFFLYGTSIDNIAYTLIKIALSQLFTLASIVICYAFIVRGLRYRLTMDETIAGGMMIVALSLGLYCFNINNIRPFFLIFGFVLIFAVYVFAEKGLFLSLLMGVGAALAQAEISLIALAGVGGAAVFIMRKTNIYVMAFALIVMDLLFAFVLNCYESYHYANSIMLAAGVLIFAMLPQKLKTRLKGYAITDMGYAAKTIVNRNRLDLFSKLNGISTVLYEMQGTLLKDIKGMPKLSESKNYLANELAKKHCLNCYKLNECERLLGMPTSSVIYDIVNRAIEKGKATIIDVPEFLTDRCPNVSKFLFDSQQIAEVYGAKKELADAIDNTKIIMSEQVSGLAGMLTDLAREVKHVVTFDSEKEERIIDELAYKNVIVSEAIMFSNGDTSNITIVVRECDAQKSIIGKVLTRVMDSQMIQVSMTQHSMGKVSLSYVSAPKFDGIFGESNTVKEGSEKSGDTKSIVRIGTDKVLIAVCDSMGSGRQANEGSSAALSLVESFYKAGIDDTIILSLINKLLSVRNEENFQTLDMCVINLRKGFADFIKLGAPESVLRKKEGIKIIKGGALPLGILDNVKPYVERIEINSGDMIVLMSDGITQTIGAEGAVRICEQNKTTNPQTMAELIMQDSEYVGRTDDKTVICCRLFNRI